MKKIATCILLLIFLVACLSQSSTVAGIKDSMIFQPQDKDIVERVITMFSGERNLETGDLMIKIAKSMMGTPYVAHTLETGVSEDMVVNLREMDCTTFAENVLALTRTIKSENPDFDKFVSELEQIRYRDGKRNGYLSRLHYFSDWIFDNNQKRTVQDVSAEIAQVLYPNKVDFMSKHPDSYQILKSNPELIQQLRLQEEIVSERVAWYIPKDRISEFENQLRDGDIVALTTSISGLDVTHVGLVVWENDHARLLHASSKEMKVVISEETLEEYLANSKSSTGIMVARPLQP